MSSLNFAPSKSESKIARGKEKEEEEEEEELIEKTKNLSLSQRQANPFILWRDIKFSVTTPTSSGIVCFGVCLCIDSQLRGDTCSSSSQTQLCVS